jgi:hypothetical protein
MAKIDSEVGDLGTSNDYTLHITPEQVPTVSFRRSSIESTTDLLKMDRFFDICSIKEEWIYKYDNRVDESNGGPMQNELLDTRGSTNGRAITDSSSVIRGNTAYEGDFQSMEYVCYSFCSFIQVPLRSTHRVWVLFLKRAPTRHC